ncbi:hypothetical protein [Ruminococcus sp.]|uniref:hypothetical protein n=1 Tax=Ruminococcus sp. TaxID=41978 RepID=UPI003AB63175
MTEQDVNNTLHSFDVIKQYQASGQSFEDFFEENKDLVKNEYSHEFKFIYYSHSTHRVWITDDCFLEHKRTMDFNGYTEESDEVYIKRLGVDDRYECCTIKDDDEYIAGRLTQSVSSDDIIDYLKHYGVKAAEFPCVYSSFSDNIGKENLKNAYLDTCSWEVKERYSEQQDILDFTPIDIERKTRFTMLKEELACCEQVGFDSINQALLECAKKDIFKDEILKYAVFTENEIESVKNDLSQAEIETIKRRADMVSIAKELINEFTVIEFENDADFSDLSHIPIAYTTDEILEFPINVFVDLEKMSLVKRYDNNREFDNEKYFGESEDKMYMILGNLEFDELVSVPDYVREEIEKDNALDMTNNRSLSL